MANIVSVNTDNLNTARDETVEFHGPDCSHIKRLANHPLYEGAFKMGDWDDADAAAYEYNADFIEEAEEMDEDPADAAYKIAVFPCTGIVKKTTVTNGIKK